MQPLSTRAWAFAASIKYDWLGRGYSTVRASLLFYYFGKNDLIEIGRKDEGAIQQGAFFVWGGRVCFEHYVDYGTYGWHVGTYKMSFVLPQFQSEVFKHGLYSFAHMKEGLA